MRGLDKDHPTDPAPENNEIAVVFWGLMGLSALIVCCLITCPLWYWWVYIR